MIKMKVHNLKQLTDKYIIGVSEICIIQFMDKFVCIEKNGSFYLKHTGDFIVVGTSDVNDNIAIDYLYVPITDILKLNYKEKPFVKDVKAFKKFLRSNKVKMKVW